MTFSLIRLLRTLHGLFGARPLRIMLVTNLKVMFMTTQKGSTLKTAQMSVCPCVLQILSFQHEEAGISDINIVWNNRLSTLRLSPN